MWFSSCARVVDACMSFLPQTVRFQFGSPGGKKLSDMRVLFFMILVLLVECDGTFLLQLVTLLCLLELRNMLKLF